jgi:prepilin-type N-terminal cleavage/methylation domain-containing protein/prepilin-type processing-associated H-X9-DG protein
MSLIEIMVVLVIIGVLASLLLPALSGAKESGKGILCVNNHRQVNLAFRLQYGDNDDIFVQWARKGATTNAILPDPLVTYWPDILLPYAGNRKIYNCPKRAGLTDVGGIGINYPNIGTYSDLPESWPLRVREEMVLHPSATIVFGDDQDVDNPHEPDPDRWTLKKTKSPYCIVFRTPIDQPQYILDPYRIVARHKHNTVVSFLDGHAEQMRPSEAGLQYPEGDPRALWDRQ